MRTLILVFTVVLLITVPGICQRLTWPDPIPDQFADGMVAGEIAAGIPAANVDALHRPGENPSNLFIVDQAWIDAWIDNLDEDEPLVFANQNTGQFEFENYVPLVDDIYDVVDYIIVEDIKFDGDDFDNNDGEIIVEEGVTIWFSLRPSADVNADGLADVGSEIEEVCTFTFTNDVAFTCEGGANTRITFQPWPNIGDDLGLNDYLAITDYGEAYPQHSPDWADAGPEPFGYFAGGFIFNNTAPNSIAFTDFSNLIGGTLEGANVADPDENRNVRLWRDFEDNIVDNQHCFGFNLSANGAELAFDESTLINSVFNGILVSGNNCVLDITGDAVARGDNFSLIDRAWINAPEGDGLNDAFCLPHTAAGNEFDRLYGVGNGILIEGIGADVDINDCHIRRCSLNGIEVLGDDASLDISDSVIGGEDADDDENGNGLERDRLVEEGELAGDDGDDNAANDRSDCYSASIRLVGEGRGDEQQPVATLELTNSRLYFNATRALSITRGDNHLIQIGDAEAEDQEVHLNNSKTLDLGGEEDGEEVYNDNRGVGIYLESTQDNVINIDNGCQLVNNDWGGICFFSGLICGGGLDINFRNEINVTTDCLIEGNVPPWSPYRSYHGGGCFMGRDRGPAVRLNSVNIIDGSTVDDNLIGFKFYNAVENTVNIDESSVNSNNMEGCWIDQSSETEINVTTSSTVSLNGRSGIYGWKSDDCAVTVNHSDVNQNENCGVWFAWDSDDGEYVTGGVGYQPSNDWCRNDVVTFLNTSNCNDNECLANGFDNDDYVTQAGILMEGEGHVISLTDTHVDNNLLYGVRTRTLRHLPDEETIESWCDVEAFDSFVNSNVETGIYLQFARRIEVDGCEINNNGELVGEEQHGLGVDVTGYGKRNSDPVDEQNDYNRLDVDITDSEIDGNHNSGIWINGQGDNFAALWNHVDEVPEDWIQPEMEVNIETCTLDDNKHGIVIKELYDADCILNDLHVENHDADEFFTGYGIWIAGQKSSEQVVGNEVLGTKVFIQDSHFWNNEYGVYFGHNEFFAAAGPDENFQSKYYASVEGCEIYYGIVGVYSYWVFDLGLVLQPFQPAEGDPVLNYFCGNEDYSVVVQSRSDEYLTALLIDACVFDGYESVEYPYIRPAEAHVFLEGSLKGWNGDENAEDTPFNPTDDFATIRKCKIFWADGTNGVNENTKGIHAKSLLNLGQWWEPRVHIRNNNFFVNETNVELDYNSADANTKIYNNTFLGDLQGEAGDPFGIGIHIVNGGLVNDAIFNNIFQTLETGIDNDAGGAPDVWNCCFFDNTVDQDGVDLVNHFNIEVDPLIHYVGSSQLSWLSPCINAGLTVEGQGAGNYADSTSMDVGDDGIEFTDDDRYYITASDIGCTGGGRRTGVLNAKHFNIIYYDHADEAVDTLWDQADNDIIPLPPDDYAVSTRFEVDAGYMLEVEANTAFYIHEDDQIYIRGGIDANGWVEDDSSRWISFLNYPGEGRWDYLRFYQNDLESTLDGCEISHADRCIDAYGPGEEVNINNSLLEDGNSENMWVSGNIRIDCLNTEFVNSQNHGLYLYNNNPGNPSQFTNCTFSYNGTGSNDAGVKVSNSSAVFDANEISLNSDHGFYLYQLGEITLNSTEENPNLIYNNGQGLDQGLYDYRGAEIRIRDNNEPTMLANNVWDIVENPWGEREGKFIYNGNDAAIELIEWYWGDDWRDAEDWDDGDNDLIAEHFFWADDSFDFVDSSPVFLGGGPGLPPEVNNLDEFLLACNLRNQGQYVEAIDHFWNHVRSGCETTRKQNALHQIQTCYLAMDGNLSDLNEDYLELAEEIEETDASLAWIAKKLAWFSIAYDEQYAEAQSGFIGLREEALNRTDSLFVEMDILFVEEHLDNNLDNCFNYDQKRLKLEELIENEVDREPLLDPNLPTEFKLFAAFPNPFNSMTRISYQLPEQSMVCLKVFDSAGREVTTIVNDKVEAGAYQESWNAANRPSGIYFYRLQAGSFTRTMKLVLVK